MEKVEYEIMYHREEDYWWYVGLRDLILAHVARLARDRGPLTILDAGCGTGKLLETCRGHRVFGLEPSSEAFRFLRTRGLKNLARASVCRIPFPDETFDVVFSMDVLYCVEPPGDVGGLREMVRVLKPGGFLLMNLPAYEFLRSHHDRAVHTKTRYTRKKARALLESGGLRRSRITYRNTLLAPVAALVRCSQKLLRPNPAAPKSDLRPLPGLLNRALTLPLLLENRLIRLRLNLPFGLSVFCVAQKADRRAEPNGVGERP